jgi:hypothetical protein
MQSVRLGIIERTHCEEGEQISTTFENTIKREVCVHGRTSNFIRRIDFNSGDAYEIQLDFYRKCYKR